LSYNLISWLLISHPLPALKSPDAAAYPAANPFSMNSAYISATVSFDNRPDFLNQVQTAVHMDKMA
jgi:hypothetical protein